MEKTANSANNAAFAAGMRKAAILVSALDRNTVDSLLERIGPAQSELVRNAVMELDDVDPAEQDRIIEEFVRRGGNLVENKIAAKSGGGVELDERLARRIAQNDSLAAPAPSAVRATYNARAYNAATYNAGDSPFEFLDEAPLESLAAILAMERPQTIALVLSRMSPARAGKILVQFSPDTQAEVVRRLVDLEETDADILREVEQELQKRLSQKLHTERRRVAGIPAVAGIIEASKGGVGKTILKNLAARDKSLAQHFTPDPADADCEPTATYPFCNYKKENTIRQLPADRIEFTDLAVMNADALCAIAESVEQEVLILALLGSPGRLMERVLRQMPRMRAAEVRRGIENIGPVRLADVEESRRIVVETARRLHAQGRIVLGEMTSESEFGLTA